MPDDNHLLTVLLIRHAEAVAPGISGFDEYTRPLTAKGFRDAAQLSDEYASTRIDAAYSSPYLRARQTIEPMARARGLAIDTIEDLRERLLSAGELPDWRAHLRRSWNDFDYAPPGGESGRVAQALNAFMPRVDYAFWESIPMPAVFRLIREGDRWRCEPRAEPLP